MLQLFQTFNQKCVYKLVYITFRAQQAKGLFFFSLTLSGKNEPLHVLTFGESLPEDVKIVLLKLMCPYPLHILTSLQQKHETMYKSPYRMLFWTMKNLGVTIINCCIESCTCTSFTYLFIWGLFTLSFWQKIKYRL